ncbi:MAG: hypothetical protein AAF900_01025 [Bacteroidota bacterium]
MLPCIAFGWFCGTTKNKQKVEERKNLFMNLTLPQKTLLALLKKSALACA